jgi:ribonuclease VapC
LISAFTALEASVVIENRKGPAGGRELDLLVHRAGIEVVPMSSEHVELARDACRRYGKGRAAAGLDLGDCCSYALPRHSRERLLFKGIDFARTDGGTAPY